MAEIANCDNVILVLTAEYVKSLNCMLEGEELKQIRKNPQRRLMVRLQPSWDWTEQFVVGILIQKVCMIQGDCLCFKYCFQGLDFEKNGGCQKIFME